MINSNELIIFDCDGVLVDSEPIAARVLASYISTHGRTTTTDECLETFTGLSLESVRKIVAGNWGLALPDNFVTELRALDRSAFEKELRPVAGVKDAINSIKNAGIKICVASSGAKEKITHSLSITGLIDLFDGNIFSASEVANGKPAPDLFLHVLDKMAASPNNAVVIEDSPAGVMAAKNAAIPVMAFAGATHARDARFRARLEKTRPDKCFSHMSELTGLLGI